jgi:hypothetical protein
LLPDDEPDLADLLAEIAIDYEISPTDMVGELAKVLAVLRVASEEATGVLVEALTKGASAGGEIVLTDEQEGAYQQTIRQINRLLAAANPIEFYEH